MFKAEATYSSLCAVYFINPNCCRMMLLILIVLSAVLFWISYKSVEFFDKI